MASANGPPVLDTIGQYDLLSLIAEGSMGAVFKGRQRLSGQIVAIKVVLPAIQKNPVMLRRFEQEFRTASTLDHPNLVRAIDFCNTTGRPFLVMEYVEGQPLGHIIERDGRLPEAEAVRLIVQVARGLQAAHERGIIHRDVKPDNILVTPEGQAKLTDLGLVKEVTADLDLTRTGRGLGTPFFMAPEQFRDAKNADPRSDIYSLGATLYMMVTGKLPFDGCSPLEAWTKKTRDDLLPPRQVVPSLSARLDRAVRRAMSFDRQQRPASCLEWAAELVARPASAKMTLDTATVQELDLWFLLYESADGQVRTWTGQTPAVQQWLREHGPTCTNIRLSRSINGPYEPLEEHPSFRTPAGLVDDSRDAARDAVPGDSSASHGTPIPRARNSQRKPARAHRFTGRELGSAVPAWFWYLLLAGATAALVMLVHGAARS